MIIGSNFDLYAKHISRTKGYGVYSRDYISSGSVVETAYCIPVSSYEWEDFYYGDPKVLPLGFGSIYNHSDDANILWRKDKDDYIIRFIARKDIEVGEEICHNYGKLYWKERNKKKLI